MAATTPRYVLPREGDQEFSFELRKENEPARTYATVVASANSFPQALRAVLAWAARHSEAKLRDGERAFPRVKYGDQRYTATLARNGYVFLAELGYRPEMVVGT